jgi:multicomponent Na+:H+ antiporter subunit E
MQLAGLALALLAAWMLWSGIYKPLLIWLGVLSTLLAAWMAQRMGFFRHVMPLRAMLRLPGYWAWLIQGIVKSSLEVARIVLSPSLPISPTTVELPAGDISESGRVLVGNSITLSPGTVTIDLHEGTLLVHCLTRRGAEGLRDLEVQRRAARLERS